MRQLKIESKPTNRSENIDRYLSELSREGKVIDIDEELELANRIRNGDNTAVEKLVKANLRFVVSVAKQYARGTEMLGELIAQGNLGLIEAAHKFDPSRGFKFISFAVWFIRKEIHLYLNESNRSVRIPTNAVLTLSRAKKAELALLGELDRDPSIEEIVEEMEKRGWPTTVKKLTHIKLSDRSIALESNSNSEEEFSPIQWLSSGDMPTQLAERGDTAIVIARLFRNLTQIEREVVCARLGLGDTESVAFTEIGERYQRTGEWSRQVFNKAIRKMKCSIRRSNLKKNEVLSLLD